MPKYLLPPLLKSFVATEDFISIYQSTDDIIRAVGEDKTVYSRHYIKGIETCITPKDITNQVLTDYYRKGINANLLPGQKKVFQSFEDRNNYIANSNSRFFVDLSIVGTGKTHNTSQLTTAFLSCERIVWLQKNKYNRTVAGLDKYSPVVVRHRGLKKSNTMVCHDGGAVMVNVKFQEVPDVAANCININMNCRLCKEKTSCLKGEGEYGAKFEIAESLKSNYLIAHPLSLPSLKISKEDVIIIEEASDLLELVVSLSVDSNFWAELNYIIESRIDLLCPIKEAILSSDIDLLQSLSFDFFKHCQALHLSVNQALGATSKFDCELKILSNVITFCAQPHLIYSKDTQKLTTINYDLIENIKQAKKVIFLDATFNYQVFYQLNIEVERLEVVLNKQKLLCSGNVLINVKEGLPKITRRSPKEDKEKVENYVRSLGKDVGIISPGCLEKPDYIVFGRDSRGSNRFEKHKKIAILVNYKINLDTARTQFDTIFAPLTWRSAPLAFSDYYEHINQSDILQAIGRLRFTRRNDEQLTCELVGEKKSFEWLQVLGFKMNKEQISLQSEFDLTNLEDYPDEFDDL